MQDVIALLSLGSVSVIMGNYIREFTMAALNALPAANVIDVQFSKSADVEIDMEHAIPMGLVIGGLLTNSATYA